MDRDRVEAGLITSGMMMMDEMVGTMMGADTKVAGARTAVDSLPPSI
jgi:hypothetical protein